MTKLEPPVMEYHTDKNGQIELQNVISKGFGFWSGEDEPDLDSIVYSHTNKIMGRLAHNGYACTEDMHPKLGDYESLSEGDYHIFLKSLEDVVFIEADALGIEIWSNEKNEKHDKT